MKIKLEEKDLIVELEDQVIIIPHKMIINELTKFFNNYDKEDLSGMIDKDRFMHFMMEMPNMKNRAKVVAYILERSNKFTEVFAMMLVGVQFQLEVKLDPIMALSKELYDLRTKKSN